MYNVTQQKENF